MLNSRRPRYRELALRPAIQACRRVFPLFPRASILRRVRTSDYHNSNISYIQKHVRVPAQTRPNTQHKRARALWRIVQPASPHPSATFPTQLLHIVRYDATTLSRSLPLYNIFLYCKSVQRQTRAYRRNVDSPAVSLRPAWLYHSYHTDCTIHCRGWMTLDCRHCELFVAVDLVKLKTTFKVLTFDVLRGCSLRYNVFKSRMNFVHFRDEADTLLVCIRIYAYVYYFRRHVRSTCRNFFHLKIKYICRTVM